MNESSSQKTGQVKRRIMDDRRRLFRWLSWSLVQAVAGAFAAAGIWSMPSQYGASFGQFGVWALGVGVAGSLVALKPALRNAREQSANPRGYDPSSGRGLRVGTIILLISQLFVAAAAGYENGIWGQMLVGPVVLVTIVIQVVGFANLTWSNER